MVNIAKDMQTTWNRDKCCFHNEHKLSTISKSNQNKKKINQNNQSIYLRQINIKALGKRPHRGQVSDNQARIIIVHSIWVHPTTKSTAVLNVLCKWIFTIHTYTYIFFSLSVSYFNVLNWDGVVLIMLLRNFFRFSARCIIWPVVSISFAWCAPSEDSSSFCDFIAFSVSRVVSRNHWAI